MKTETFETAIKDVTPIYANCMDDLCQTFDDKDAFVSFMDAIQDRTTWIRPEIKNCTLKNFEYLPIGGPAQTDELRKQYNLITEDSVYEDTGSSMSEYCLMEGSKMFLAISAGSIKPYLHPLSHDAYTGWIMRTGCFCPSIPKLPLRMQEKTINEVAAEVFSDSNKYFATCKYLDGKIRAVNGANYVVLDQSQMVHDILDYLEEEHAGYHFDSAKFTHAETEMVISFPAETEMLDEYISDICAKTGTTTFAGAFPMMSFKTSDIGSNAAQIQTGLNVGGTEMLIGDPLRMEHKGSASEEKFKEEVIEKMFSLYKNTLEAMSELADVVIAHPVNCFLNVGYKMNLTKAHVNEIAEEMQLIYDGSTATALDVYYYLQEVVGEMKRDSKVSGTSVVTAQENLARKIVGFDWKAYDTVCVLDTSASAS